MGKHSTQFAVIVRPTMRQMPIMVGMPFVDLETATAEMQTRYAAGNWGVWVNEINPVTGEIVTEKIVDAVDDYDPLS